LVATEALVFAERELDALKRLLALGIKEVTGYEDNTIVAANGRSH
jgi:hypothetical protein